jgi:plastocyanin
VPEEPAPPAPTEPAIPALGSNEAAVTLENFAFNQPTITVKAGTKVIWINRDPVPHTVTFDDKAFDSGTLAQGQTASFTFDKPGEFDYYCLFHGGQGGVGMSGKVIVTP